MSTSNRLKPDPESRKALKELSQKNILYRERVGFRSIIRSDTGELESVGLSHYWFSETWKGEPNFCQRAPRLNAWVSYNNQRAMLTASYIPDWFRTYNDASSIPPANTLADKLLRQPDTKYTRACLQRGSMRSFDFPNIQGDTLRVDGPAVAAP